VIEVIGTAMEPVGAIVRGLAGAVGSPTEQRYLFEARQLQAISLGVHIPLVCFGIAFPAIVLFVEGLWLRTGDPVYRAVARRWSKVMPILFAVGVVTGTVLSFELRIVVRQVRQRVDTRRGGAPSRCPRARWNARVPAR
jgi:hypothetical protein